VSHVAGSIAYAGSDAQPGPLDMVVCRCGFVTCGKALYFSQLSARQADAVNRIGQEALSQLVVVILGRMYILKLRLEMLS